MEPIPQRMLILVVLTSEDRSAQRGELYDSVDCYWYILIKRI